MNTGGDPSQERGCPGHTAMLSMMSTTDAGKETITPPALAQGDGILIVNAEEKIVQANAPLQDFFL